MLGIETDQWLTSVIYFDDEYQTIQSIADLYPSGIEITSNDHDFMGNVIQTKVKQTIGSNVYEYNKWFDFDSYGRLQQVSQQITGDNTNNKVILAKYTYDELGNIATKAIHNEKQTESYTYDLTGRTISVTSPSFSYALDYEESPISSAIPRLDGNICAMRWGSSTTPNKAYTYTYDHVGQLQSADYKLLSNNVWNNSSNYKEGGLTYDLNGNILTVQRTNSSGAQLHNIAYTYEGYRLKTVNVNNVPSAAYAYDSNGNITSDGRRGVTINYNILNFPEQIIAGDQQVSYIYSAAGEKLATNANGSLTYYRSVMVYGNDNKLLHILTPEGTVSRTEGSAGTNYTYNYFKKDQIGSTRAVLSAVGNTLQNVQSTDYYPFGLAYSTNNLNKNKYLFSGKELQDASIGGTILGLYDFGARQYDPVIGRWMSIDLLANKFPDVSPFVYCLNNPINLVDLHGLEPIEDSTDSNWWEQWHYIMNIDVCGYDPKNTFEFDLINPTRAALLMWFISSHSEGILPHEDIENNNLILPGGGASSRGNNKKNTSKSIKSILNGRGLVIKKPFMLRNRKDVIEFLWYNSFRDGRPFKENAAYLLKNGWYVILPNVTATHKNIPLKYDYNQNTGRLSFWEQEIQEIIHVHPKGTNTTKFSDGDIDFMTAHPNVTFSIIVNSVVYEIWGRTYLPTETVAH